jgi:pSer/pThr/pTyr-binding forkhead associated (FHA) protein/S1-C subfamily serine protease
MSKSHYVTIGTSGDNDVEVADSHVSRHHAVLFADDEGWHLSDLASTNGTFVNGQRIDTTMVGVTDVVTLGHAYRLDLTELGRLRPEAQRDSGTVLLRLGKSHDNDVVIDDPHVSRYHALVRRGPEGVEIFDAGSTNGLFLDDQRVRSGRVEPESTIGLGKTCILSGRELIAQTTPVVSREAEPVRKTGKTTWIRRQIDLMRSEQVRELRELERKHAVESSRTRGILARGGALGAVAIVVLTMGLLFSRNDDDSLTELLENRRDAVVMVYCLIPAADEALSTREQSPKGAADDFELFSAGGTQASLGSGFVFHHGNRPVVITNRHVIESWLVSKRAGHKPRMVILTQGVMNYYEAEVLKAHAHKDVAVLGFIGEQPTFSRTELQPDWSSIDRGDRVGIMSFPLGFSGQRGDRLIADIGKGLISNKFPEEVKHDVATAPGSSGGPIFNDEGQIIAINTAQSMDSKGILFQGLNWGVPIRYALELVQEL